MLKTASLVIKIVGYVGIVMSVVSLIILAVVVPKKNKMLMCEISLLVVVPFWLLSITRVRVITNWTLLLIGLSMVQNVINILNWKTRTVWLKDSINDVQEDILTKTEKKYGIDREHIDYVDLGTLRNEKKDKITEILIDTKYTYRAKKIKQAEAKGKVEVE